MRIRNISLLLFAFAGSAFAQVRVSANVLEDGASSAEVEITIDVPGLPPIVSAERLAAVLAGERLLTSGSGGFAAVRRFPLLLPAGSYTLSVEPSSDTRYTIEGTPNRLPVDTASTPWSGWTRIVDRATNAYGTIATLEVAVASLQGDRLTIPSRIHIRIDHAGWESSGTRSFAFLEGRIPSTGISSESPFRTAEVMQSQFASGSWYRIDIDETGVYRMDRTYFQSAGVSPARLDDIRKLRVFGNGGTLVPEPITLPRSSGLQEVSRLINDANGNNRLDDGEYVAFFGRSVRSWRYTAGSRSFSHTINSFTERNPYFFTFDETVNGRDMDSLQSSSATAVTVQHVVGRIAVDQERLNFKSSGRYWVGELFNISDPIAVYTNLLPGLVPGTPVKYRAVFFSRSGTIDTFRVFENSDPVAGPVIMSTSDINSVDQTGNYAFQTSAINFQHPGSLPGNRSNLKFVFGTRNSDARGWLDWFEIFYRRSLDVVDDRLFFPSPDTAAVLEYTIRGLSSRTVLCLDVSDHANVKRISGIGFDQVNPTVCTFRLQQSTGSVRELAVVGANGFLVPPAATTVPQSNLRGPQSPARFIIISPTDFMEEAERLKAHRESSDSLPTMIVDINAVYNEFGGGIADPMAIRDFLAYARANYPGPPRYVLFFGNGHFDYRNILTSSPNWVVPYETEESNEQIRSYASDDFLAMLDAGSQRISLAIGRLPGRNLEEMRSMVDKIIRYETSSPYDSWRNRITFVADDGLTSTTQDDKSTHTAQAENLAQSYTPATFERKKIYIVEYPTVLSGSGRRKPQANADIVAAINQGTIVLNYTGHGNQRLWAHEQIFVKESDLPLLTNRDRMTLLVAATCNFAQWDDPAFQSAGELMLTMDHGGAVAVVTATRSVYSNFNAELNYTLYTYLFGSDAQGLPVRMGDAYFLMKQIRYDSNDQKFHLLGDPTVRLARPRGRASIDSLNGASTAQRVSVPALGVVQVRGVVRRNDGSVWSDFTGRGLLEVNDAKRTVAVPEWSGFTYVVGGSILYRGDVSIQSGSFNALFPVPKDVTFGSQSRISLYAYSSNMDAVGVTEQVTVSGTDATAVVDTTGPEISIMVGSTEFKSGDVVPLDPDLIVDLADVSGINTSTVGIGHQLEAELVDEERKVDLGSSYRGKLDTYQSGRAVTTLTGISEGRHRVVVRAWDTRNNSASAEVVFEVRSGTDVDVFQVVNYPNPFARSTSFTFQRTAAIPVDVEVRIYTVAGRMVQRLVSPGLTDRFVRIPWDGRDRDGSEMANGVYLYKIVVRSTDGAQINEVVGKLAIMR